MTLLLPNLLALVLLGSFASTAAVGADPADKQRGARIVVVTSPERGDGFKDRGECEAALGIGPGQFKYVDARAAEPYRPGSAFNRARGNASRCEHIEGEYQIVVRPAA